jgi:hypothetical protein
MPDKDCTTCPNKQPKQMAFRSISGNFPRPRSCLEWGDLRGQWRKGGPMFPNKRCPRKSRNRLRRYLNLRGLSPGPLLARNRMIRNQAPNQPAFSTISRPLLKQLELTGTSSWGDNASRRRLRRPNRSPGATPLLTRPDQCSQLFCRKRSGARCKTKKAPLP